MEFEWDRGKEEANRNKHGFDFSEAVTCFYDPESLVVEDISHSAMETRFYLIGRSSSGEILTVRHTRRGTTMRIFGCARWRKFRKFYETAKSKKHKSQ